MEVKKTYKADLENRHVTGFLLGLILALAIFLVAMEYTDNGMSEPSSDEELLDDIAQDLDMMPALEHNDRELVASKPQPAPTPKVKPVDRETAPADEALPAVEPQLTGEDSRNATPHEENEAQPVPMTTGKENGEPALRVVEQLPEFPGGMSAFVQWLTKNLRYPEEARSKKIVGMVVATFIVNKDGSITQLEIQRSAGPILDREAMRVLRLMPKWKPGIQDNKPCRTMISVPVVFKL